MQTANSVTGFSRSNSCYTINTNGPDIRIVFMTDDIVRFRASFDKVFAEESYILTMTAWDDRLDGLLGDERTRVTPLMPKAETTDDTITFRTKSLKVVISKSPFGIEIYDLDGNKLHADLKERALVQDHLGRVFHYVERQEQDRYYGFGETTGKLNKAGSRLRLSPKDAIGYDPKRTSCLYKHIPFYIKLDGESRHAVGLFYHNTWESVFEMGSEVSGYWHPYSYFCAEGGDIDLFFINGPDVVGVTERYTDLTGKTVLPPKYSLGYLGSTMYYSELPRNCDDEIIGFVEKNFEEGIPVDGFQLSSGYTVGAENKRYVFTWNTKRFPDPEGFFKRMRDRGIMVSPNIKPGILLTHPNYRDFNAKGGFIRESTGEKSYVDRWWGGAGSFVDFTNPDGREVWKNMIIKQLSSKGTSSIWNDNCEYEINDRDARCDYDGAPKPAGMVKALQANMMAFTSHLALKESRPDERPYVIARSGCAGVQRYAQTWAGDNPTHWKTLKYNIATILGMGLSGVANQGCDIGGFQGPSPEAELLVRWVQNGIFQPRFSIHSCNTNNTVTEPWMYEECTGFIRDAIRFRYDLIPYLYSLMNEAHEKGTPILRPLFYEFQQDAAVDDESIQFMFGPSLLVANVVEKGVTSHKVYLPAGCDWYDWRTRERYAGGQEISIDVDLSSIPVFLRDGAIVPTTSGLFSIAKTEIDHLRLVVTPRRATSFTLYEDDGETNAYKDGDFLKTRMELEAGEQTVIRFRKEGTYASPVKSMVLEVINEEKGAFWVKVAGDRIPQILDRKKWEQADCGWMYDASLSAVRIKYPNTASDYDVIVSFEKFDLISMEE